MNNKEFIKEFENMLGMSELKALSKHSLTNPLTDEQFKRMMDLKKELFEVENV